MSEKLFKELVRSVREAGAILRGEVRPSRRRAMRATDPSSRRALDMGRD